MKTRLIFVAAALGLASGAVVVSAFVESAARDSRAAADSGVCQHRLSFLYRALRFYHDKYGKFPPAYLADEAGKPRHSWRILVLETLGEPGSTEVYNSYRFDEPWDGPNNRKLADRMPPFFACPSAARAAPDRAGLAHYVVITDPRAVFRGADSASLPPVADMHADTIVLTETLPGVSWLDPRDLELSRMSLNIDDPTRPGIASKDSLGPGAVLMDGRIRRFGKPPAPEALRSMILARPPAENQEVKK